MEVGRWGLGKADRVLGGTGGGAGGSGCSCSGPRSAGGIWADRDRGEAEANIVGEGRDVKYWHECVCGEAHGPVGPEQGAWKEGGK